MQKKIAITGGIGSGKTLAMAYIAELGYPIFSCDEINRELLSDPEYVEKIKSVFPDCVKNGKIDKNALKNTVFGDNAAVQKLNSVAHPMIMKRLLSAMAASNRELVFAEVPLLFEGNFESLFDEIIIIKRDLSGRIAAIQQRDGLTEVEIKNRITAQFNYHQLENRIKNLKAHIIENEGDMLSLKNKISATVNRIK